MKLLKDILYKTGIEEVEGSTHVAVESITFDSRQVKPFSVFVAIPGTQVDGHDYIQTAVEAGAVAVVCERMPETRSEKVTYVRVKQASRALAFMADNFYDHPSSKIKLVGITGTNGKTTVVTLLYQLFRQLGYKCGVLSTVRNIIGSEVLPSTHTTPDALQLNALLHEMVEKGCQYCFMEVSSHAVVQQRVAGLDFNVGVFTNITHDHLDYHKTFKEYIRAKKRFFDELPESAFALVNSDDRNGGTMVQNTRAHKRTFGMKTMADYRGKIIENQLSGLHVQVGNNDLYSQLVGDFNAYNILAVYAVAMLLGEDNLDVLTTISGLGAVDGRFQLVKPGGEVTAVVDYAHTPDALKNVLATIKNVRTGNEKVITVVGCGGNRDKAKRPLMARIACEYSDQVVLTSDNPRNEEPEAILKDMQEGMDPVNLAKTLTITDRKEAIKMACTLAQPGDILLIAGKGHEKYQEIKGVKLPFDDVEVVFEMLQLLKK